MFMLLVPRRKTASIGSTIDSTLSVITCYEGRIRRQKSDESLKREELLHMFGIRSKRERRLHSYHIFPRRSRLQ